MGDEKSERQDQFALAAFAVVIILIVLSAVWDLSALVAKESYDAAERAREYSAYTENQIAERCTSTDPLALRVCIQEVVEASHENQRSEYDLVAQKNMARWALMMLVASALGTGLTGIGIWYVRENLAAVRETNEIQRNIGKQTIRAYVSVKYIKIELTDGPWAPQVSVRYANTGQSPARNVRVKMRAGFMAGPVPIMNQGSDLGVTDPMSGFSLGSGQGMFSSIPIANDFWDMMKEGVAKKAIELIVHGRIDYIDVFGDPWVTNFKMKYRVDDTGEIVDGRRFTTCKDGNEAT